jgi:hypothetical protein
MVSGPGMVCERIDLHIDTGRVHRGDPPLTQITDACRPLALWVGVEEASRVLQRVERRRECSVRIRFGDSWMSVVLLDTDDLHDISLTNAVGCNRAPNEAFRRVEIEIHHTMAGSRDRCPV